MIPKRTSYKIIFLPKKIGSKKDVKNAPEAITDNVTETLETLMAPKKVNQCNAIQSPAKKNPRSTFLGKRILFRRNKTKNMMRMLAIPMRYQTNGIASKDIRAPKTAVNPHIKTMK